LILDTSLRFVLGLWPEAEGVGVMLKEIPVIEQRYQAVLAVLEDGLSVTEVAAKVGVSRQSVHGWLRRYAEGGLDALADRSHRPRSCPHQMAPQVQVRLVELRQLHPTWGPDRLLYRLERDNVDPLPSRAAVARALARLGLVNAASRRERRRKYRRWERGRPMELWQFDVMGGVMLTDGRELKAVTGVDDHSRFCVAVGLVERATSRPVCQVFAQALRTHGVPAQVLTDNGKVFTGRFSARPIEVLFDRICRENGIEHLLTAPRSPTTTGKIERFHGTLRTECLGDQVFPSLAAAQRAIDVWVHAYNTDRPHQSNRRHAPVERFTSAAPDPGPPLNLDAIEPPRRDDDWVHRRVASNGIVCVGWQQVSVGKHRHGQIVDVHVTDQLLEFWSGHDLIRTVVRESKGDIRKKRASQPAKS
jgi:transposase InsO family protein